VKSKFLSVIVTLAVILGFVVVPAMVSAAPGDCWLEIDPALTKVGFNQPFNVNVTMKNPTAQDINTMMCHINFTASLVEVTGVDYGATVGSPFIVVLAAPTWDNATGSIDYDAGCASGTSTNATSVVYATIHMKSKAASGIATLEFIPGTVSEPETAIIDATATDHTDWASVVNGTVKTGAPQLTVDVVGSGTVKINNAITPTSYPNTTGWSWDQVVPLKANPATGWNFDHWTGTNDNGINPTDVTMSVDQSVTAYFVEKQPILDVDTTPLSFSARFGDNTDSKTVEITNAGGHVLDWAVGSPPTWTPGNYWAYYNFYEPFGVDNSSYLPGLPGYYEGMVTMGVTGGGSGSDYECSVTLDPAAQRTILNGTYAVLWNATALVDEYTLDMVQQLGFMSLWPYTPAGPEVPVLANLTWAYDSAHGWPYYLYKTWTYNLTMDVNTYPGGSPVDYKVIPCKAIVTNMSQTAGAGGAFTDCYEITHFALPTMTPFMQTWWSPTAQNFVQQADGGTYDYPPMDVRALVGMSVSAPVAPPAWLSFDKTHGSLGLGESELLTVTASTSGLNVTPPLHTGSFTISAPGSIQEATVDVSLEVLPATTTDVFRNLPGNKDDLNATYPGMTFDVYVNFTAPFNKMNAISLTDLAPAGWSVAVTAANCTADGVAADYVKATGNKVEVTWWGDPYVGFPVDTVFSALYQVTVPVTAKPGINVFPLNDGSKAWAEYYEGEVGPYTSNVTAEYQIMITVPGYVVGETRDVNTNPLPDTTVTLERGVTATGSDESTPDYSIICMNTGTYWLQASKDGYYTLASDEIGGHALHNRNYPQNITWTTPELLAAGNVTEFEGDYGLTPQSCTMSYAMKSVNLYLFWPTSNPEWGLNVWKAQRSVQSWQNPYHT